MDNPEDMDSQATLRLVTVNRGMVLSQALLLSNLEEPMPTVT